LNNLVLKVGLTGNISTGKSTVAKLLSKYPDIHVLDADKVVHNLLEREDVKKKLVEKLGKEILNPDGSVNRKRIARKVFNNPELLRWLEQLLHPLVYEGFEKFCRKKGGICVLEAALIFEKGNKNRFDYTVLVYTPFEIAKERALKKGFDEEDFHKRWAKQMDIELKRKMADFVIDNTGSLEETKRQVEKLVEILRRKLKEKKANP